jgi:hypothetical protein
MTREPRPDVPSAASLPASGLAALAGLRGRFGLSVAAEGGLAWLHWPEGDDQVVARVRPLPGAVLYVRRDGHWYRPGDRLPSFGLPVDGAGRVPLVRALVPEPVVPEPPGETGVAPMRMALVRDECPRPATALWCPLAELARWADMAPTARFAGLAAARLGASALVVGRALPEVVGEGRFWGEQVLVRLGFRTEPDLPERATRSALGAGEGEMVVVWPEGVELVPPTAFRPLTRAGVRLAAAGVAGSAP